MHGTTGSGPTHPVPDARRAAADGESAWRAGDADQRADRASFAIVAALLIASLCVEATSLIIDGEQDLAPFGWRTPFLLEGTSHLALLLAFPLIPLFLNRAPITLDTWRWALPVHVMGVLAFALAHILAFVAMRKLGFMAFGETYRFGLTDPMVWIYELRKDAFTYALFVLVVMLNRAAHYRRVERQAETDVARDEGRIVLKCGGRTMRLRASEIDAASAAGNYVEIACGSKRYLARTTLSALEHLLAASGSQHLRVHRSHIANLDAVREVVPAGTGEAVIHLTSGLCLPSSRRYRDRLRAALSADTDNAGSGAG